MPSQPTAVRLGPGVPNRITDDEATYDQGMETFDVWLEDDAVPGMQALAEVTHANATEAVVAAAIATAQSQAAVAAVNATQWAAGAYAYGVCAWSPSNGRTYRSKVAFASATDPKDDAAHWWDVASFSLETVIPVSTATTLPIGVTSLLTTDAIAYPLPTDANVGEWVGYRVMSGGGVAAALDPGPTNKVEGSAGMYPLDHPAALGKLVWTGPALGWVHTA